MALQQDELPGQVTSVRLPADLRERLDELARIALARHDIAEGRTLTTDELNARLRARGFLGGR